MNLDMSLKRYAIVLDKQLLAIQTIWLFHISAVIGITLGFFDFFVPKTPLNLSLAFFFLIWVFPLDSFKKIFLASLFFSVGILVEWLGVNHGLLFGNYTYGDNLGLKLDGVPILIGINWVLLVLITGVISNEFTVSKFGKVIIGASLMILLDFPMELVAPIFDFWEFEGGIAPLQNYIAWFLIAAFLHGIFQWANLDGNARFCINLFGCQFLFFLYFYVYYSL